MAARVDHLDGTPYAELRLLGSGSMGRVVLAEHRALKSKVCVKLLHADAADSPGIRERFRVEAQTLAALGGGAHPNLVHVRDFGVTPLGLPYLVMEVLEGRTLQDERRDRKQIPWVQAVEWTLQALEGIAVAHAAGIVHRDLKPANLFVCKPPDKAPYVKVLDFGIAKILSSDGPVSPAAVATGTGMFMGTPRYASPEQVRGEPVDERTDLYSMGLVLFELVTGTPPFSEKRRMEEIILAQVTSPLPVASDLATQRIPPGLDLAIERATSKRREDRFASAEAFASAMRDLLEPEALSATRPLPAWLGSAAVDDDATVRDRAAPARISSGARVRATVPMETAPLHRVALVAPPEEDEATALRPTKTGSHFLGVLRFVGLVILSALVFGALWRWVIERWLG